MPKSPQQWWKDALRDRCADHEKLMQHCLDSAIKEIRQDTISQVIKFLENSIVDHDVNTAEMKKIRKSNSSDGNILAAITESNIEAIRSLVIK